MTMGIKWSTVFQVLKCWSKINIIIIMTIIGFSKSNTSAFYFYKLLHFVFGPIYQPTLLSYLTSLFKKNKISFLCFFTHLQLEILTLQEAPRQT